MENIEGFVRNLHYSINYAKICLFTSWQIAQPYEFEKTYSEFNIDCKDILSLEQDSDFIKHCVFTNWRMFIIEIDKIYDDKSKQGFNKLFNKISNKVKGFECKELKKIKTIKEVYDEELRYRKYYLEQIRFLRDKYYGHRDRDFFIERQHELKFVAANEFISLAETTISEISANYKLPEFSFHNSDGTTLAS